MKKVLLSLAAVSAIAIAASPAAAQSYGHGYGYGASHAQSLTSVNQRQAMIAQRINLSAARGQLTRVEARRLSLELQRIENLERRYRSFGLTRAEANDLNRRLDRLQAALQAERRDDNRRYGYGYGRW